MSNLMDGIKAGDKVIFHDGYGGFRPQEKIVDGVTPGGKIKIAGSIFSPAGKEVGKFARAYIQPFDQKILDDYAANQVREKLASEISKRMMECYKDMSRGFGETEQLNKMSELLKDMGY